MLRRRAIWAILGGWGLGWVGFVVAQGLLAVRLQPFVERRVLSHLAESHVAPFPWRLSLAVLNLLVRWEVFIGLLAMVIAIIAAAEHVYRAARKSEVPEPIPSASSGA